MDDRRLPGSPPLQQSPLQGGGRALKESDARGDKRKRLRRIGQPDAIAEECIVLQRILVLVVDDLYMPG